MSNELKSTTIISNYERWVNEILNEAHNEDVWRTKTTQKQWIYERLLPCIKASIKLLANKDVEIEKLKKELGELRIKPTDKKFLPFKWLYRHKNDLG